MVENPWRKNLLDSALIIIQTYAQEGYKQFLTGNAYLKQGKFKEVHQVGEGYWQHEYARICEESKAIYERSPDLSTYVQKNTLSLYFFTLVSLILDFF